MAHVFPILPAALALALATPLPAAAQIFGEERAPEAGAEAEDDGFSLMEEGARLFFEGMMSEMDPALRQLHALLEDVGPKLADFVAEMGPALRDVLERVEDWSVYHPPEVLPNGDIILRRREPLPPGVDPTEPGSEIEL